MDDSVWLLLTIATCAAAFVTLAVFRARSEIAGGFPRGAWAIGTGISVACVLVATVVPGGGADDSELQLNPVSGLDELQALGNIVLFIPLGGFLALQRMSRSKAVLVAMSFSVTVEIVQFFLIEGRYTATSDVILNSIGALLGHVALSSREPRSEG
jgi:VanZ like family